MSKDEIITEIKKLQPKHKCNTLEEALEWCKNNKSPHIILNKTTNDIHLVEDKTVTII